MIRFIENTITKETLEQAIYIEVGTHPTFKIVPEDKKPAFVNKMMQKSNEVLMLLKKPFTTREVYPLKIVQSTKRSNTFFYPDYVYTFNRYVNGKLTFTDNINSNTKVSISVIDFFSGVITNKFIIK